MKTNARLSSLGPMSARDQLYRSDANKTFENEGILPSLPVPDLKSTMDLYLDTVKPVVTEDEYKQTQLIVEKFLNGDGPKLHEKLVKKSQTCRNWVEDWWLEYAYLRQRTPLIPFCNMCAPTPFKDFWLPASNSGLQRMSLTLAFELEFWKMLRSESMRPIVHRGIPWAMDQFKRLFNTCRIPGEKIDSLKNYFNTESEGPLGPTNIIVICRGYIFSFEAVDREEEEPLTPAELLSQFEEIHKWCNQQPCEGPGVGALTSTERSIWAKNREYLIGLHPQNLEYLETIEKALKVIVLDDSEPLTQKEILHQTMCGNVKDRWADKSLTSICFNNGFIGGNSDHAPFDGLCVAILAHYVMISLEECKGVWMGINKFREMPKAKLLDFKIDDKIIKQISNAKNEYYNNCKCINLLHSTFTGFGKSTLRSHKFHPEAFTQVALQLAYYRLHGKPAPTYCTASTRQFYHGRTETCRSCFPENVEFSKAIIEQKLSANELYILLKKAITKFQKVMTKAMNGYGVDRVMLGYYILSQELGMEMPELFTDPGYLKSGGAGSYILSTSCSGYWDLCGGVVPMRDDGYAAFYGIEDDRITFCITAFNKVPEININMFYESLTTSLLDMHKLLTVSKL